MSSICLAHGSAVGIIKDHEKRFNESKEATRASRVNLAKDIATRAQKVSEFETWDNEIVFFKGSNQLISEVLPAIWENLEGLQ